MRFLLDAEQRDFARTLDSLLAAADSPSAARAWARGDHALGRALWDRLAKAGVFALAVPEAFDGAGRLPLELTLGFEALGRHAVPGPAVETVAAAVLLSELVDAGPDAVGFHDGGLDGLGLGDAGPDGPGPGGAELGDTRGGGPGSEAGAAAGDGAGYARGLLSRFASGDALATLRVDGGYALDADVADVVLVVAGQTGEELWLAAEPGPAAPSHDPARRLFTPAAAGRLLARGPGVAAGVERARAWGALATAAQAVGVGRALLEQTVGYVRERRQFGVAVGSFQAVKHRLADVLLALEFARPLVHAAALSLDPVDIAMAKVTAGEAACTAARAALQLHGAIGYTEELDLSLWLRKARPLRDAWGTPASCRARIVGVG
ncbi:acyl-CoA dehydrogenase [Streptacidiphilus melanogenes]|uniref:acyl-CoA dehydrogenase n=1 Tax=Streptacidiphilus melanogenes TaxID=411235 RepID=UPI0005A66F1A|nr:acyl-CoA dehydrogenase [Streptacidiphilus melanogenes]